MKIEDFEIIENPKNVTIDIRETTKNVRAKNFSQNWCECENSEFLVYTEDGECSCGVYKHHVHCTCGKISQVG